MPDVSGASSIARRAAARPSATRPLVNQRHAVDPLRFGVRRIDGEDRAADFFGILVQAFQAQRIREDGAAFQFLRQ